MRDPSNWATMALALSPDGHSVGAVAVELTRGPKPLALCLLARIDVARDPLYRNVADWLYSIGSLTGSLPLGSSGRRRIIVDTSDYLRGRLLGRSVLDSTARRTWMPLTSLVEIVTDVPRPEKRGGYMAVARRDVIGTATQAIGAELLEFTHGEAALARDLRVQMTRMAERRDRDDKDATGGELAISAVLALWDVMEQLDRRVRAERARRTG